MVFRLLKFFDDREHMGGQQSPARSWGSDFPSEFNALTGCRYRQNEIDALKRLSLYVIAMSINNYVPAVKMFTLCSYKCRDSSALWRAASGGIWKLCRKICFILRWNKSLWFRSITPIQISALHKSLRYKSVVAQLYTILLTLETQSSSAKAMFILCGCVRQGPRQTIQKKAFRQMSITVKQRAQLMLRC